MKDCMGRVLVKSLKQNLFMKVGNMAVAVNEHFASVFTKEENTVGVSPNKIRLRFSEPNIDKGKVIEMLTAFKVDK